MVGDHRNLYVPGSGLPSRPGAGTNVALGDFLYDPWTIGVGTALAAGVILGGLAWAWKRMSPEKPPPPPPGPHTRHATQRAEGMGNVNVQGPVHGDLIYNPPPAAPVAPLGPMARDPPAPRADPPRDFTGRRKELETIGAAFAKAQGGVVIQGVRGKGGVGKTALALAAGQLLRSQFPDGQHVVELRGSRANPTTPEEAMESVLLALDPQAPTKDLSPGQLKARYRTSLTARRMLLILDDAAGAEQVEPLLPPPPCGTLVTSRVAFHVPGMETLPLDVLTPEDARRLLQALCPRLTPEEADAVAQKCGRLPLALRIAGSTLDIHRDLHVDEYLQRLKEGKERLRLLKAENNPNLDVEACFQYSYDKLPEDLKARWRALGVFSTSFFWPGAADVWGLSPEEAKEALRGLVARSLVEYDEDTGRHALHDLLRDFAKVKLTPDEEREARLRHARHYLNVGSMADDLYLMGGQNILRGLRLFDAEWAHFREAQRWIAQQPPDDREAAGFANEAPDRAAYCLSLRLHARERLEWLRVASKAARLVGDKHREGNHLGNLGLAYAALGDTRKAIEYYEQALIISREIGDRHGEGNHLGNLGSAYAALGDARKAIEYHEQALVISREIGDRRGEGSDFGSLGTAYATLGDTRKAIQHYEQALVISREIGDRHGEGNRLGNLGLAYAALGDTRKAIEYHEQALVISREIGDRHGEGNRLGNLGSAYATLGDTRKAIQHYEQALVISREIGDRRGEGNRLGNLGLAHEAIGDLPRALELHEQALHVFEAIGSPHVERARKNVARVRSRLQGRQGPDAS